jgi:hypothetical protein
MNIRIPKKIQVGPQWYTIHYDKGAHHELHGNGNIGETDHLQGWIRLDNDMPPDKMQTTFLHEILHAVCYQYGAPNIEADIDRMANGLAQAMLQLKGE